MRNSPPFSIRKFPVWYINTHSPFGIYTNSPRLVHTHNKIPRLVYTQNFPVLYTHSSPVSLQNAHTEKSNRKANPGLQLRIE